MEDDSPSKREKIEEENEGEGENAETAAAAAAEKAITGEGDDKNAKPKKVKTKARRKTPGKKQVRSLADVELSQDLVFGDDGCLIISNYSDAFYQMRNVIRKGNTKLGKLCLLCYEDGNKNCTFSLDLSNNKKHYRKEHEEKLQKTTEPTEFTGIKELLGKKYRFEKNSSVPKSGSDGAPDAPKKIPPLEDFMKKAVKFGLASGSLSILETPEFRAMIEAASKLSPLISSNIASELETNTIDQLVEEIRQEQAAEVAQQTSGTSGSAEVDTE